MWHFTVSTSTIEIHSDKENSTGSKVPNQVKNVISSETDLDNITSATSNLSEIEQSSESAPSICTEPKSLEDKEIDKFLDSAYKEKKKTVQDIVQDVFDSPKQSSGLQSTKNHVTEISLPARKEKFQEISDALQTIARDRLTLRSLSLRGKDNYVEEELLSAVFLLSWDFRFQFYEIFNMMEYIILSIIEYPNIIKE
ncbi:hypothetical protein Glove_123g163 [Diversispora epigaea]|uniref:Uncharacterized protein n=1 Tax=Diversispora epigaea TaxID=1348612 RepID=A0A397J2I2_9GLOM|nr:hypothetical protein Glove_123g163 [Diversispora epigaea]